ncbi:MAG: GDSL-type esterase/lipase family protein [Candidatus Omnitrophica bacterium]|nr:GDSL-type esterase/lipase family protein [Candidatus Omnitrophota bacterium]MCM8790651.1 GDSL-type esterase/lipase family protein [Candidatus Omnitrophota bacterium]
MRKGILRFLGILLYIAVLLIGIEITCQIAYRVTANKWLFLAEEEPHHYLFKKHPYLVGVPKPGATFTSKNGITFTNNSLGMRGAEIRQTKDEGRVRVVVLGGSSTYCIGVSDDQTWPYYLEKILGSKYEVINMGVPGYTTVENLIQTALWLSDISPDICVYYEGWNDMRNMHVKGLKPDYSDFHGRSQYDNLVLYLFKFGNKSATLRFLRKIVNTFLIKDPDGGYSIEGTPSKFTVEPDKRSLLLYARNLKLILALCRAQGIRPIMVPQIINEQRLARDAMEGDKVFFWIPYVKMRDLGATMKLYNNEMKQVCAAEGADFVAEVLDEDFDDSCFYDYVHFSKKGNEKFAAILADYITKHPTP